MKKIFIVQGGGRPKGNTAQLIGSFVRGAEEAGHQVEVISLIKNEVKGCLGCNACRYGKPCVQKDSFNELIPKIKEADLLVFASPLYFWTLSSRIKAFIERFYCIAEEDPNPPLGRYEKYPVKDCALLMTAADNFFWTFEQAVSPNKHAAEMYRLPADWMHFLCLRRTPGGRGNEVPAVKKDTPQALELRHKWRRVGPV